ncbi:hypothetical protein PM082_019436 [Marasmius tenuissimus]|nr:hypothetical protein PM082_019436 [Marasmius tenuissimus]
MSPKDRDEEKALFEPYQDNGRQLNTSDEPPLYRTEGQSQDTNVDPSAERNAHKKNYLRKMGRHLAIFTVLFFVWQTFFRRPKIIVCRWPPPPGSEPLLDVLVQSGARPEPLPDEFPWPPQLTLEECVEWPQHSDDNPEHGCHDDHGHDHPHHKYSFDSSFSLPASSDALGLFA